MNGKKRGETALVRLEILLPSAKTRITSFFARR
jgi:hypothetical protein